VVPQWIINEPISPSTIAFDLIKSIEKHMCEEIDREMLSELTVASKV
jgi:hypothetical protein